MEKRRVITPAIVVIILTILTVLTVSLTYGEEITSISRGGASKITYQIGSPGIETADLNSGLTSSDLVNTLLGEGVTVSNVTFTGANVAAGTFSGGEEIIGFGNGIILSTGNITNVVGPNEFDNVTADNGLPGDTDLNALIPGFTTFDAAVLEFDFVPDTEIVQFEYVFSSDEYNEWVNSEYNDVFGFFVNGENIALIPGTSTPVSINNVNNGNPFGTNSSNPEYYINNDLNDGGGSIDTEMDGLTVVLTATANVTPGEINHIRMAIADAGDRALDSNVIIRAESFVSPKLLLEPASATNKVSELHTLTATLVDENETPVEGENITFNVTAGPHNGTSGTDVTDANGTATWNYTGENSGTDTIVATGGGETSNEAFKTWESDQGQKPLLTLEPESATNILGNLHILRANLVDENGTPVANETITFNVSEGPFAGLSGKGVTDANGTATWSYGITTGTDTIVATGGGETSNAVSKTWEIGAEAQTLLTVEPRSATNEIGTSHIMKATLLNENGSPVSGEMITFVVTDGPHVGTSGTSLTDENGIATWCYYGIYTGNDTISARGGGQAADEAFKTWEATNGNVSASNKYMKIEDSEGNMGGIWSYFESIFGRLR
ncbi:hypothetical protein FTO70_11360 [Methanosarcina sp. KYL-1]|uniref:choice-of-anchor L domain-containing protein n=1 Tax=Methanosarcina sp. KYL-1 TaxID=2602068 RepID=UPI002100CA6D|nr:choice-of-anchor L domain-containing protein [Methanosarcina sp. KYL-1]MCQ1536266.1 hypothetical protein [Methanosarcina sp. KYL-1]